MAKPANVYTDEKAKRLMATFRASMAFAFLICWFEIVIIRPSDDMRREMVSNVESRRYQGRQEKIRSILFQSMGFFGGHKLLFSI